MRHEGFFTEGWTLKPFAVNLGTTNSYRIDVAQKICTHDVISQLYTSIVTSSRHLVYFFLSVQPLFSYFDSTYYTPNH